MLRDIRSITLHVLDINGNVVAELFDSAAKDTRLDAVEDIIISYSRNGNEVLSFTLYSADGTDAYESRYYNWLKNQYQIRANVDGTMKYFLLTTNSVSHNARAKTTTIKAESTACLLKYQQLDLEFSDTEGNSTGTLNQLITAILDGTEWQYDTTRSAIPYEKYDPTKVKYRSLIASKKTGAFGLISKACDLFEFAPFYDTANHQIYALPLNPFSVNKQSMIPDMAHADNLLELDYGNNLKDTKRDYNSSNIATVLYVYGAYGNTDSGYCDINELPFYKYTYSKVSGDGLIKFPVQDCFSGEITKYIYCDISSASVGDELEFWSLDRASELYVWNKTKQKAYRTIDATSSAQLVYFTTTQIEQRLFDFIMDFSYYNSVDDGLSDTQIQYIAEYQTQTFAALVVKAALNATYLSDNSVLENLLSTDNYCKVNTTNITLDSDGYFVVYIGSPYYIWHADYTTKDEKKFTWRESEGLDNQGDSINSDASVVYLYKNTSSGIFWVKCFIKTITKNSSGDYSKIKIFATSDEYTLSQMKDCACYVFAANTITGTVGVYEECIISSKLAIVDECKVATVEHPVYYIQPNESSKTIPDNIEWCWMIKHSEQVVAGISELYCCNKKCFNDSGWVKCIRSTSEPSHSTYGYWYNPTNSVIYVYTTTWEPIYTTGEKYSELKKYRENFYSQFLKVFSHKDTLDMYNNGEYLQWEYTTNTNRTNGNYYFVDSYNNHILYTTDYDLSVGKKWTYKTSDKYLLSDEYGTDKVVKALFLAENQVTKYASDMTVNTSYGSGSFVDSTGAITDKEGYVRTGSISVREETPFMIYNTELYPGSIFFYTGDGTFISKTDMSTSAVTNEITTPEHCEVIKLTLQATVEEARAGISMTRKNRNSYVCYGDEEYYKINFTPVSGTQVNGSTQLMTKWTTYADLVYVNDIPAIQAQDAIIAQKKTNLRNSLGYMYAESFWSPSNYADGQEQELLADAVENMDQLCLPTVTYTTSFNDLYGAKDALDITPLTAVHIVDNEIPINCFGYIDTVNKCYDKPWKTTLTINTKLTKMSQSSFQDVLTTIAQVAEETKTNSSIYTRAGAIDENGHISAERLKGELEAQVTAIDGGASSWETDDKGGIVFTAADGQSSVKITGAGILIANTKDEWDRWYYTQALSGSGINASAISTGKLSALYIEAGSISADKLMNNVGENLEISSNEALTLYATATDAPFNRSAGSLLTKQDGVSFIDIAQDHIIVNTGGQLYMTGANTTLEGGTVEIKSDAELFLKSGSILDIDSDSALNLQGATMTLSANAKMNVDAGSIDIKSGSTFKASDANGNTIVLDEDGTTITGQTISLLTNSGTSTDAKVYLGSDKNYVDSSGRLSLHSGDLVLDGVAGTMTATKDFTITSAGNLNLNADTSALNISAGTVNVSGTSAINLTSGALTASGTSIDIQATSSLDIDSPNLKIDSAADTLEVYGKVVAEEGLIGATYDSSTGQWTGGWTIGDNMLSSGSGTTYVALCSDPSNQYAMWAGDETAGNCKFRVKRDGSVYLNSLWAVDKDDPSKVSKFDLGAAVWKLWYHTVKAYTTVTESGVEYCDTITLSDNTILNFKHGTTPASFRFVPGTEGESTSFDIALYDKNNKRIITLGSATSAPSVTCNISGTVTAKSFASDNYPGGNTNAIGTRTYTAFANFQDNIVGGVIAEVLWDGTSKHTQTAFLSTNDITFDKSTLVLTSKVYAKSNNKTKGTLAQTFDLNDYFEAVSSSLITKQGVEVTPIEVRYATSSGETAGAATNITGTKHSSSSVTPISSSSLTLTKTTLYTGNPEKITPIGDPVTPSTTTAYLRNTSALYFNPVTRYSSTSAGTILTDISAVSNTGNLIGTAQNFKLCSTAKVLVDVTPTTPSQFVVEDDHYCALAPGTYYRIANGTYYTGTYYSRCYYSTTAAYTRNTSGTVTYYSKGDEVYYSTTQPYTGTKTTDKYYATDGATYYDKGTSKSTGGYEVYTSAGSATYYDVGSADTLYKADEEITRYTLSSKTAYITDDEGTTYYKPGTAAQYIQYDGDLYEPSSDTYATLPKGYAEKKVYLANDTTNWVCPTTGESVPLYKEGTDATVYETTETLYKAK